MGYKDQPTDLGPVYEPVGGKPDRATPYNSHPVQPFGASGGSPDRANPLNIHPLAENMGWYKYGPERVINGSFEADTNWTKGVGWSIGGGSANAIAAASDIYQGGVGVIAAISHKVTFTVSNYSAGEVRVALLGAATPYVSGNGTYSFTLTPTNSDTFLYISAKIGGFSGSIDNVSVKEVLA